MLCFMNLKRSESVQAVRYYSFHPKIQGTHIIQDSDLKISSQTIIL
jgi:hypothetical protein